MSTTTPSMSLLIPDIGDSDYPDSIDSSLTTIDTHTHASGSGVQIPTGGITDLAVTSAKLAANAVTTAKITDANVTRAKLEAVGQQSAGITGTSFATSSTTAVDITGASISITTTGRPVMISVPVQITLERAVGAGVIDMSATLVLLRGSTNVAIAIPSVSEPSTETGTVQRTFPSALCVVDSPAAGTYTYKLQVLVNNASTTASVTAGLGINAITAYEL